MSTKFPPVVLINFGFSSLFEGVKRERRSMMKSGRNMVNEEF